MKAVFLSGKGGSESLILGDIPQPHPKAGEVLIKVLATAVTPTELTWFPTFHSQSGEPRPFPIVLSHEFSGVVDSPGAGVENFKVGEKVYGLNDWFINGAQAEYCVVAASARLRFIAGCLPASFMATSSRVASSRSLVLRLVNDLVVSSKA